VNAKAKLTCLLDNHPFIFVRTLLGILSGICLAIAVIVSAFVMLFWGWRQDGHGASPVSMFTMPLYFLCFFLSAVLRPSPKTLLITGICGHTLLVVYAFFLDSAPGVAMEDKVPWFVAMVLVAVVWWIYFVRLKVPNQHSS
jgi:hypothetical protein